MLILLANYVKKYPINLFFKCNFQISCMQVQNLIVIEDLGG